MGDDEESKGENIDIDEMLDKLRLKI